jgi:hypothetical protein
MTYFNIIQHEFIKAAGCWSDMNQEQKELIDVKNNDRQEKEVEDRKRTYGEDVNGNRNFSGASKNSV